MLLNGSVSQVNGGENCAAASQRTGKETVLATEAKIILAAKTKRRCERSEHLSYVYISIFATFQQNILFLWILFFQFLCFFFQKKSV